MMQRWFLFSSSLNSISTLIFARSELQSTFAMSEKDEVAIASALNHANAPSNQVDISADKPPTPAGPTDSHVLSQVEPEEKGLTQQAGDTDELTDLGWSASHEHIEEPLIAGLSNEDLWLFIRRFDKVSQSLHEIAHLSESQD